uniref:Proteasome activator complex subunit 3 n=1 Tax=Oncorhynchus mykiss TaxID=8022 RepID=A0A8C7UDV8_ONCMY
MVLRTAAPIKWHVVLLDCHSTWFYFHSRFIRCVRKLLFSQVDAFRERITGEAENLVADFFPKKLLELDSFLKEPILNVADLKDIHSEINVKVPDPIILNNSHDGVDVQNSRKRKMEDGLDDNCQDGPKVFVMPGGMIKSNGQLVDLIERVKPEIRTLIEKCNTVKMWVQLLIPRIEDGNNFGVSIQEETVAELRTVEGEAASYLDQISRYYITRAKLVSKITKYPHVEDYQRTVTEIDEKEYISLKIIVSELRNQYVTLHDMILKNIEKIKRPRSSNNEALY